MKTSKLTLLSTVAGVGFILLALMLLVFAVQNSELFDKYYVLLVLVSVAGLALLTMVLFINIWRLLYQVKSRVSGSRLRLKLVGFFVLSTLLPTALLYFFAVKLLDRGIDTWFDIHVAEALQNSFELGQAAIDERKKRLIRETHFIAEKLDKDLEKTLLDMREQTNANELTLFDDNGKVLAFSHSDVAILVPKLPSDTIISQVKVSGSYHETELGANQGQIIRIVIKLPPEDNEVTAEARFLHAVYQMPQRIDNLLKNVNETSAGFKQVEYMEPQLRQSLIITLSLALLLALAGAIWLGFYLARKLSQPVMDLAQGTRDVAVGVYKKIPGAGKDELGFLVDSFNQMISKVNQAQLQQKRQWDFLDAVLTNLSSGVIVLDDKYILKRKNHAVEQILNIDLDRFENTSIFEVAVNSPDLNRIFSNVQKSIEGSSEDKVWEIEDHLNVNNTNRVINIKGRRLPAAAELEGSVIVLEDITARITGQRNAAWSEVARRLAHEIKNPLTPIQLSAERIRNKCLNDNSFVKGNEKIIERGTDTIISQVEALKKMVGDFSDYAKTPKLIMQEFNLKELIHDVVELYKPNKDIIFELNLRAKTINADSNRIRQLLHNILKNTLEIEGQKPVTVNLLTEYNKAQDIKLKICDDGGGIPADMLGSIFEPYVSSKPKGTGLGLAIVKRIVEEHDGRIEVYNDKGGACFDIELPSR